MVKKLSMISILISLWLSTAGCSPATSASKASLAVTGTPAAPITPASQATPAEASFSSVEASCGLLNTHDLAGFFPTHTETILPKPQINPIDHPLFAAGSASGMETTCAYYTYHLPGSLAEVALQVSYWLDRPDSDSAGQAWSQDWPVASAQGQTLVGIGDDAFFKDGRLYFKKGSLYVTVTATETDWNLNSPTGMDKQLGVEKQVALDMLSHMKEGTE